MKKIVAIISFAVLSLTSRSQTVTVFAGAGGFGGYSGDGGPATAALIGVNGMAFDQAGDLYFSSSSNHVIRKIDANGIITTVAGTGTEGDSGDGGPAISAELTRPSSIVFDQQGNLYIRETKLGKIRKIDINGNISTYTTITAHPSQYYAMAIDLNGNIYLDEPWEYHINKITPSLANSIYAGMLNAQGHSGDGGPATSAELYRPKYLTTNAFDNLYISEYDGSVVRKVDASGIISTVAGNFGSPSANPNGYGGSGDGGLATAAHLASSKGIALNSLGELFIVCDYGEIRYVDASGIIHTLNADLNNLLFPDLVIFDNADNLYVSGAGQILKIHNIHSAAGINDELINGLNFSIYPNPTNSTLNIDIKETANIRIVNIIGATVAVQKLSAGNNNIDVSNFTKGIYFLQSDKGGAVKFIKE